MKRKLNNLIWIISIAAAICLVTSVLARMPLLFAAGFALCVVAALLWVAGDWGLIGGTKTDQS